MTRRLRGDARKSICGAGRQGARCRAIVLRRRRCLPRLQIAGCLQSRLGLADLLWQLNLVARRLEILRRRLMDLERILPGLLPVRRQPDRRELAPAQLLGRDVPSRLDQFANLSPTSTGWHPPRR
jgi:hypothetical protein